MRPTESLVHSRARIKPRYALLPLEGFPFSRLPNFPDAQVRVLATPRIGAEFVQYLIDLPAGKAGQFAAHPAIETFFFILTGEGVFDDLAGTKPALRDGSFGLTPPGRPSQFTAKSPMSFLIVQKKYEPAAGYEKAIARYGHESDIEKTVWADNKNSLLQTLIPDDWPFDLAMNIFTFNPGSGLPIVETHVMEHGAYFLQGKGLYYLDGEWMEVEKDDFIWMGPFCPQSFYATGPTPSRYLYYKNVNREISL